MFQRCVKKWIRNDNIQYSSIFQPIIYSIFQHIPTSTLVHQGRSAGSGSFPGKLAPRFWATREHTLLDLVMLVVWNRDEFSLMMFLYVFVAFSFFLPMTKLASIFGQDKTPTWSIQKLPLLRFGSPTQMSSCWQTAFGSWCIRKSKRRPGCGGLDVRFPWESWLCLKWCTVPTHGCYIDYMSIYI